MFSLVRHTPTAPHIGFGDAVRVAGAGTATMLVVDVMPSGKLVCARRREGRIVEQAFHPGMLALIAKARAA